MKSLSFCVSVCLFVSAQAQTQWTDDFTDGTLSLNPTWTGDTAFFIHNAQQRLQLADSTAGSRLIQCPSQAFQNARWSGIVVMDFNPSSSNFTRIQLAGDSTQGFFLDFGGSTDDRIELTRSSGGVTFTIAQSPADYLDQSHNAIRWSVTRDSTWHVRVQHMGNPTATVFQGQDSTLFSSAFFRIECRFTVTRATRFEWDSLQVRGTAYIDSIPPQVISQKWVGKNLLAVRFTETMTHNGSPLNDQFGSEWTVPFLEGDSLLLERQDPLTNGKYFLNTSSISDAAGLSPEPLKVEVQRALPGEVTISEIFADPTPLLTYSEEFIELYNHTNRSISLEKWQLLINGSPQPLIILSLAPHERKIHTSDALSLPNQGAQLILMNNWGDTIDFVPYAVSWHTSQEKMDGGWSIERRPEAYSCEYQSAWFSCTHLDGATPGFISNHQPEASPILNDLSRIEPTDSGFVLHFNRFLQTCHTDNVSASPTSYLRTSWNLPMDNPETIDFFGTNCLGEALDTNYISLETPTGASGLEFSEILYNGDWEFVELVHRGSESTDLSRWKWANKNADGNLTNLRPLTDLSTLASPGEVLLFTDHPRELLQQYPAHNRRSVVDQPNMKALPSSGEWVLIDPHGVEVDHLRWNDSLHHPFVPSTRDVSLFRNSRGEWSSSPSNTGGATPGIVYAPLLAQDQLEWTNTRFSPNGDGHEDALSLHVPAEYAQWVLDMKIYSIAGQLIDHPISNRLLSGSETVEWNGIYQNQILPNGQYLSVVELAHPNGEKKQFKQGCLLWIDRP